MKLLSAFIKSNLSLYLVALWVTGSVIYILTTNL